MSVCASVLGAVVASLLALYVYFTWNFNYWRKRGVAGPRPRPYLGTYPKTATLQKDSNYLFEMDEIYKKYWRKHRFVGTFEFAKPVLLVLDPALAKDVYVKSFKHFNYNELSNQIDRKEDPMFGANPFILRDDEWKNSRAEVSPAMTMLKMKPLYPIVEKIGERMVQYINDNIESGKNEIISKELAERFTAEAICNCGYGLDSNSFGEHSEFLTEARKSLEQTTLMFYQSILLNVFPILRKIIPLRWMPQASSEWFIHLMGHAIKTRMQSEERRDDYLNSVLELKAKKNLSPLELAVHGYTLFLDGYETSSHFLSNILNSLARNPEIQEKLRAEIASYETIGYDVLCQMPYLDLVFHEGMRISPFPFPLWKMCTEDIELADYDGTTVTIEKGTRVVVPSYSLHRHPEFYTDPEVFMPERFDESTGKGLKYYKDAGLYMPFGNGPRLCLGMRFATMQIKIAICALIKNFEIQSTSDTEKVPSGIFMITMADAEIEFRRL